MVVRQHIPSFFEGAGRRETAVCATLSELLDLPWVRQWRTLPKFQRFSQAIDEGVVYLMVEESDGRHWVIGVINYSLGLDLPVWRAPVSATCQCPSR